MDSFEMRCTPVRQAKASAAPPSLSAPVKTRLPQENIPWQPVLSYKKMQPVNFYSWKKGCISKFKQKRTVE